MSFKLSTGNIAVPSASAAVNASTGSVTIKVTASCYLTDGWVQSTGVVARIYVNGSRIATKTILGNGTSYTASTKKTVSETSGSISRGTSSKKIEWYVEFWEYQNGSAISKKATISGSKSIAAKPSYAVTYDGNGGSGEPSAQTKWYGTALALSNTAPTRTGHSFKNWNTKADGSGTSYGSGASYTENAALTLYAQWTADTYTITYNGNGGSGAPSAQTKTYGKTLALSSVKPTRTNYNFLGWSTNKDAATATYTSGGNFTTNANTTLYAIWEVAYIPPKISELTVERCDVNGNVDDYGTYAKVEFKWSCDQTQGANAIRRIVISHTIDADGAEMDDVEVKASGNQGTVSQIIGGTFNTDVSYTVLVMVYDTLGTLPTSKSTTIPKTQFIMDFLSTGGIAFGKPAETENLLESEYDAKFNHDVYGGVLGLGYGIPIASYTNINTITNVGVYAVIDNNIAASLTNMPVAKSGRLIVASGVGRSARVLKTDAWSYMTQIYITYDSHIYVRPAQTYGTADVWNFGAWSELLLSSGGTMTGMLLSEVGAGFGGKGNAYDGKTGVIIAQSGAITVQHSENPLINFAVGTNTDRSGWIYVNASGNMFLCNDTIRYQFTVDQLRPTTTDAAYLGGSSYKWKAVYAVNGTIQTSDRNQKENINDIGKKYEELFKKLHPVTFELKGNEHDRLHVGFIAQDVKEAMDEVGISSDELAAYCVDVKKVYDEETEQDVDVLDENGEPVKTYSLRYSEFIALNTHMIQKQQTEIELLKKEIEELKALIKGTS